ncbi:MAG: bifunctional [glutamate--ammonia ligase]-adenylyl-L-tyrosine phosphorylase/[glutamate--ammonia-ligase] adenylyltransferase, partial [Burkholderiaceae bacterium]
MGASDWRGTPAPLVEVPVLSPFARRALTAETGSTEAAAQLPVLADYAASPWFDRLPSELAQLRGADTGTEALAVALRTLRRRVMLALIARDVTEAADLAEVVATMTALAELSIESTVAAHAHQLAAIHGTPRASDGTPQDLIVVGMGKLGGGELNVSSDIDLVFVYDEEGSTRADTLGQTVRSISNHEFFEKLGRRVIAGLDEVTAAGRVFRVDMRLRPNGSSGPLVVSNAMLEEYLMVQGREWERFAWLKGRVVSAPVFASAEQFAIQVAALDAVVRPFVYRKYLDFGAIAALRELHQLIRAETARRDVGREDREDHVKLGRGGIREIEFIAQTFQVIRGGREAEFRSKSTLATLSVLAERGVLSVATAATLAISYVFLRDLEHALQYVDDAQTHQMPIDADARQVIARLMGATSADSLVSELRAVQEAVAATFDAIFVERARADETPPLQLISPGGEPDPALIERLKVMGFEDPAAVAQRLRDVLSGRHLQGTNQNVRARVERLLQQALRAAGAARDATGVGPDEVFARFANLAEVIVGRSTYVALLDEYPQAFERVMRLLSASRWATDYLVRHPILLDELLDDRLALVGDGQEPDWAAWQRSVEVQLVAADDDTERQMNLLRDAHHAQVFRLLVADLDGRLTVERLADHLSTLADATLQLALKYAWRSLPSRH